MNIGINIFSGVDFESQVKYFKKYNVDRIFLASETPDFDSVFGLFRDNGIICENLHAPFDKINDMWGKDAEAGAKMLGRLKDSVDKCEKYGIPTTVVHVSSGRPMPEITPEGEERYEELFRYAAEKGVKIALENLRYTENLLFLMEKDENIGFCWDCGHESCYTEGIRYCQLFGDRLAALHIADNSCVKDMDDHFIPYDGNIDFEKVAEDLAASGYQGTLMLEIGRTGFGDITGKYENMSDEEYIRRATEAARRLADRVESIRQNRENL